MRTISVTKNGNEEIISCFEYANFVNKSGEKCIRLRNVDAFGRWTKRILIVADYDSINHKVK